MKMKHFIALMLCLIMVLSMAACGNNTTNPEVTTDDPSTPTEGADQTTEGAPEQTTEAAEQTTEAPEQTTEEQTTEAEETTASIEFDNLAPADQAALLAAMPSTLPDGSTYVIACRTMSFDYSTDDYYITGNSSAGASFVDVQGGALFGQAIKINAVDNNNPEKRAEIEVTPLGDVTIEGSRGVMFYVDFSDVDPAAEPGKMCCSVTINTNDIRSNGPENKAGSGIGYYYDGTTWVQTTNITSCRMNIPDNFAGWVYVPASSFYDKTQGAAFGETFPDILVTSMRCYTDGYTYSATDFIIFDEIVFVK